MNEKVIGGEMEINDVAACCVRDSAAQRATFPGEKYSSGRSALLAILMLLGRRGYKRILLPDYLCATIVSTVKYAGFDFCFYQLGEDFLPTPQNLAELADEKTAILLINYFGLQNLSDTIADLRSLTSSPVIEDDVQALFVYLSDKLFCADYSFTSVRKWLPVPDGGLARAAGCDLPAFSGKSNFSTLKLSGLLLKAERENIPGTDSLYLELLRRGEDMIDAEQECGMSDFSCRILSGINTAEISSRRIANAKFIIEGLASLGIKPMITPAAGAVPFFIPVYLNNRDAVRRRLFDNDIFCPVHWPTEGLALKRGADMERHELSIIIDQRYDINDLSRILNIFSRQ